jgi:aspartate aminotransferase-like enzyme
MLRVGEYLFKRADTESEFEAIHRLNHRTFVGEIPQHTATPDGRLVDKFHDKSTYFVALHEGQMVGMISIHDQPPFSVGSRLPDPSILERPGTRPLEVRLLAVEPGRRASIVFSGLAWVLFEHARSAGYTHMYISGVEERLALYGHIGFQPLGPAVPCGAAQFVPMVVSVEQLPRLNSRFVELWRKHRLHMDDVTGSARDRTHDRSHDRKPPPICLLPGPVTISQAVRQAFQQPAIYHRGPEFIDRFNEVRGKLSQMVGGKDVAILNGSGTLANEVVAATLAAEPRVGRGVLLVNGEFGRRLARQAARFGLFPNVLEWPWGQPWNLDEVAAALAGEPPGSWVWGVHQESSTGVLNDLSGLVDLARSRKARVCVDCISSLGAVPFSLRHVHLATGATGKSLGSIAGAALVFADKVALSDIDTSRVPSYLDVAAALASKGPCYTFPSPTLLALEAALEEYATPERAQARYAHYAALGEYVRGELRELGLEPLTAEEDASPVVTTFAPPGLETSATFVNRCLSWGFEIGGQSGYLAEQRLVQIATMGAVTRECVEPLFERLRGWLNAPGPRKLSKQVALNA